MGYERSHDEFARLRVDHQQGFMRYVSAKVSQTEINEN
jgi:hypothetical protein